MDEEQPRYALKQDLKRVLIPKVLQLIGLGIGFYFAIWLNLFLLEAEDAIRLYVTIGVIIVIVIAVVLEIVLLIQKVDKNKYLFYSSKVSFKGKEMPYVNVDHISFRQNFFDKLFNTGTIVLHPGYMIEKIPNLNQVYFYIQKLVQLAKQKVST
jgi:hypothetical protein